MNKNAKIYIAGHRGLVGSAITQKLRQQGYENLLLREHSDLDLSKQAKVHDFFAKEKPEYVFIAAAKVGGIHANNVYPADFIRENLHIQTNLIEASYQNDVKRLLFLGSSCIYPKACPQPIKEKYLLTGELEATNRPYAIAKIAGIEQCWAYNRQYGTQYICAMPTNLYGINDNFDLETSHVLPALLRKIHEAKVQQMDSVIAWGSGSPRREFLYSGDLARACVFLLNLPEKSYQSFLQETSPPLINIGYGEDISIKALAELIKNIVGYPGEILWDKSKPDGTMRKLLDVSQMRKLGWSARTSLKEGIEKIYQFYLAENTHI